MSDDETRKRAENNARVGRTYYQALTDAAGYPNGMEYWPNLEPSEKYYYAVTALDFIEKLSRDGRVSVSDGVGLRKPATYGEGDCAALLSHFTETHGIERAEFIEKIYGRPRKEDE
jgi:hypothetical protein